MIACLKANVRDEEKPHGTELAPPLDGSFSRGEFNANARKATTRNRIAEVAFRSHRSNRVRGGRPTSKNRSRPNRDFSTGGAAPCFSYAWILESFSLRRQRARIVGERGLQSHFRRQKGARGS